MTRESETDEPAEDGAAERPALGTVLEGRYELVANLGEGGVGWVYGAKHLRLGTSVAIKMLQAPYQQHDMLRPRFEREAKVLAELRHPHIVTLTDYSVDDAGRPYLVMELLEGRTLGALMDLGPMDDSRARRITQQILDALRYAHEQGFAHRDLKPTNVFISELPTEPDHVKLLDFGFVKLLRGDSARGPSLTRSGIAFGTPSYMCPEQATGGVTDPRGDLYSTGVMLFEMLAGRRPFIGEIPEVIRQHLTEPVPPLSVGGTALVPSTALTRLLERSMAKDPEERFQTASEMRDALDALPVPSVTAGDHVDSLIPTIAPAAAGVSRWQQNQVTRPHSAVEGGSSGRTAWRGVLAALALAGLAVVVVVFGPSLLGGPSQLSDTDSEPSDPDPDLDLDPDHDLDLDLDPENGDGADMEFGLHDVLEDPDPDGVDEPDELLEGDAPLEPDESEVPAPVRDEPSLVDPWRDPERVSVLDFGKRIVDSGRPLSRAGEQRLRRYVRDHRADVRAHLLLAAHFVERGYDTSALERYDLAQRVDARARNARRMLPDLVRLAARESVSPAAGEMLDRIYGPDALPEIDRRLAEEVHDEEERARLRSVRAAIAGG